jgi:hypothetical protein
MGTSSGLIFFIDSHCIDGSRRSIFLDAIDVVRSPYNSDFVFIKQPPSRPTSSGFSPGFLCCRQPGQFVAFLSLAKPWRRISTAIENSRPRIIRTFAEYTDIVGSIHVRTPSDIGRVLLQGRSSSAIGPLRYDGRRERAAIQRSQSE